jgi:phosphoribosyl 1,2-cyclic phosphodiesterase
MAAADMKPSTSHRRKLVAHSSVDQCRSTLRSHRASPRCSLRGRPRWRRRTSCACGKTFRDAYVRVLQPRVDSLAALLLTHDHADAIHGIDDPTNACPRGSSGPDPFEHDVH